MVSAASSVLGRERWDPWALVRLATTGRGPALGLDTTVDPGLPEAQPWTS